MRKALVALAVLAAIAIAAAWLAFNYLDVIVKVALEHWGPDVAGVSVKVDEVQISPQDGRGRITGLEIGNPPGFAAPRAARFGEIRVALDPATVTSDVIVVRALVIEAPQLAYERGDKSTNLDVIQKSIEAYAKRSGSGGTKATVGPGVKRKFIVERLEIRKGRVTMTSRSLRGQGVGFDLPDMVLRDVGKREGGVTASQVAALVASTLQQKIALRVLTNVEALRRGGVEGAVDALKGLLK